MTFLDITHVTKRFGAFEAVRDLSLSIGKGSLVSLLGPSGCGKTTLLRMIAGLERPSAGRIVVDGQDITNLPPERRRLAMMFQSYALLPHMTVLENVRFPLRMQGRGPAAQQRRRAQEALALVKLDHLAERRPRQLSGGQQQRVALARAIVSEPRVLLLDEPLSNLDARLREDMQIELQQLHQRLGLTTIFVTHDQEEALSLSDRVVLMREGRIEADASADRIYDDPGTPFAADFLGAANVIPVTILAAGAAGRVRLGDGQEIAVPDAPEAGEGTLILRQEDMAVAPADAPVPAGHLSLSGIVEARIFLGTRVRYVVRAGDQALRILAPRGHRIENGARVSVTAPTDRARWARG